MPSIVGKLVSNRYRVVEEIGRGGMAIVYKVWDTKRITNLAMKVLREDFATDRVFMRRFSREAENLSKLQHPNIVRFYSIVQDGPEVFMLLDFVEGVNLKRYIFDKNGPLQIGEIKTMMRALCSGLHYAHSKDIVHCDIKPGNIMIDLGGNVLLMDFGIARLTDGATATMVGAGTPAYMAPEQIMGKDLTPQTDIYALGIVLYEMLTGGERPFTGEQGQTGSTSEKIRWEQLHLEAPSPKVWNENISAELENIVQKCLKKNPEERYQTIDALLEDLEFALQEAQAVPLRSGEPKELQPSETPDANARQPEKKEEGNKKPFIFAFGAVSIIGMVGLLAVVVSGVLFFVLRGPGHNSSDYLSDGTRIVEYDTSFEGGSTPIAGSRSATPTNTRRPAATFYPTNTKTPTKTKRPTSTPKPSSTPRVTSTPKYGAKWNACSGADYYSRLQVGYLAHVSYDPPYNNNVRKQAGRSYALVGQIEPGEKIVIVDGPKCVGDWIWWEIVSLESDVVGWTSEGDKDDYWLVPDD